MSLLLIAEGFTTATCSVILFLHYNSRLYYFFSQAPDLKIRHPVDLRDGRLLFIYMPLNDEAAQSASSRKSGAQSKQAATWLTPEQIEQIRDACLTDAFPTYLQGRNETIITLLVDTDLRVSELIALDWDHIDLNTDPPELFLPPRRITEGGEARCLP